MHSSLPPRFHLLDKNGGSLPGARVYWRHSLPACTWAALVDPPLSWEPTRREGTQTQGGGILKSLLLCVSWWARLMLGCCCLLFFSFRLIFVSMCGRERERCVLVMISWFVALHFNLASSIHVWIDTLLLLHVFPGASLVLLICL